MTRGANKRSKRTTPKRASLKRIGELAEALVSRNLNLQEPEVEIKAVARHERRSILRLDQLQRAAGSGLEYVFVVYDCRARRIGSRLKLGRPAAEALREWSEVTILRIEARRLVRLISGLRLEWVPRTRAGDGQFKVKVPLRLLTELGSVEPTGDVPF